MTSDLRKAAQDVIDAYDGGYSSHPQFNLNCRLEALRAALATCPDCNKPAPEGSIHTCSPQKPDPVQQIHAFGREQEALRTALAEPQECEWKRNRNFEWQPSCWAGASEEDQQQEWMTYCYGCGKKIKFVEQP